MGKEGARRRALVECECLGSLKSGQTVQHAGGRGRTVCHEERSAGARALTSSARHRTVCIVSHLPSPSATGTRFTGPLAMWPLAPEWEVT